MKKVLILILTLLMVFALSACTMPAVTNPDGTDTVAGVAIKTGLDVIEAACIMLLTVAGTAWAAKNKDKAYLQNINIAFDNTIKMAKITVGELKQTVVDGMKAAADDGKLSDEQIQELQGELLAKTLEKLDAPTKDVLAAAGADICAIIAGVGEDWVRELKGPEGILLDQLLEVPGVVEGNAETIKDNAEAIKKAADELLSKEEKPYT